MDEIIKAVSDTPLPTLLVVGGLFFLLLSVASQVGGQIQMSPKRQITAGLIGLFLLSLGITLSFIPDTPPVSRTTTPTEPEVVDSPSPEPAITSEPTTTADEVLVEYFVALESRDFNRAKELHPNLNVAATEEWLEGINRPTEPIHSIGLVSFEPKASDSPDRKILTTSIRYCRTDGSGTDERKDFFLNRVNGAWVIQAAAQPAEVKSIRCW
ncbi:hypothetical protein XM38_036770 [Halomicronema hongdechloris C2206]|uniref:ARC6 IMS domain-containing protein n=1 Tax=Halomicronema hongdechloris C2206 TaxID=1641165 RepID=A0A1Z3HQW7_9CYAN|nr:hypothetical protein [Halomicronema hongdechloris]ASC72719.1 hypothetical protein XM38_036770 [Halomicronema hongdechloris C2206]